jgi:hypothetical protein
MRVDDEHTIAQLSELPGDLCGDPGQADAQPDVSE